MGLRENSSFASMISISIATSFLEIQYGEKKCVSASRVRFGEHILQRVLSKKEGKKIKYRLYLKVSRSFDDLDFDRERSCTTFAATGKTKMENTSTEPCF